VISAICLEKARGLAAEKVHVQRVPCLFRNDRVFWVFEYLIKKARELGGDSTLVDQYYDETRYVDVEQARVYFNTRRPVPLHTIGRFLTTVGREIENAYGDGFVVELENVEHGSLSFIFRKFREWTDDEDDRRERDERLLKLAEDATARDRRLLELAEAAERRDKRMLELAEHPDKRDDGILLVTVIGIAIAVPSAAKASLDLLEYGEGTEVVLDQEQARPEIIPVREFEDIVEDAAKQRRYARVREIAIENRRMRERLEDGAFFDLAGKIMPRKKGFFKTVKGNQYPILNQPDHAPIGELVVLHARAERDEDHEIGLNILDLRALDDK